MEDKSRINQFQRLISYVFFQENSQILNKLALSFKQSRTDSNPPNSQSTEKSQILQPEDQYQPLLNFEMIPMNNLATVTSEK